MTTFGVVIPAYNGAELLGRSMNSLAQQRFDGDLRVVVGVNDGRADTLATAERLGSLLRRPGAACVVLRTPPGRCAAFRAAEELLPPGPRLFLDQDAVLSPGAVAALAAVLTPGTGVHFAVPVLRLAPRRSRVSRAYYRMWRELPYVRRSPVTIGAYAVSAAGRRRWESFPTLYSDDKWVRWHFAPAERRVVRTASYQVIVPDGVRALIRARHRYRRGNRELARLSPPPPYADDVIRRDGALRCLTARPGRWPAAAVFLAVHVAAALLPGRPRYTAQ
jgi:glycosyltransferase involved in cell wall biosynthesis